MSKTGGYIWKLVVRRGKVYAFANGYDITNIVMAEDIWRLNKETVDKIVKIIRSQYSGLKLLWIDIAAWDERNFI